MPTPHFRVNQAGAAAALCLAAALLCSCGNAQHLGRQPLPSSSTAWPAWPGEVAPEPARGTIFRQGSAADVQQMGSARWQGAGAYVPATAPTALVLAPALGSAESGTAAQHTAWAVYRFDDLLTDRPQRLRTDVVQAGTTDGGQPVALQYFVGLADQTQARWEWHGPLSADADLLLNSPSLRQRMVNGGGTFFAALVVSSHGVPATPQNMRGAAAVQVSSLTVTATAATISTKPLFLAASNIRTGSSLGGKAASALQPVQFPVVEWPVNAEVAGHLPSQAVSVLVYRQGPADAVPVALGSYSPGKRSFTDPLDLQGAPSATGGTTYRYFVQATNAAGATPLAPTAFLTVPILAPVQLQATQDKPGGVETALSWQPSDGTLVYHILRGPSADGTSATEVGTTASPAFADTTAEPGRIWWYFVSAAGQGDANATNGVEPGSLSPLSPPAQGLRGVVLTLACTTAGVIGNGSAGNPYLLSSGSTYQFIATDQAGIDRTQFSIFSVVPSSVASFAGAPGELGGVQTGGGDFTVTATFSSQGFVWTATGHCRS